MPMKMPRTNPRAIEGMASRSVPPTKFPNPRKPWIIRNGRLRQMTSRSITAASRSAAPAAGGDEPGNRRAAFHPVHDRRERHAEDEVDERAGRQGLERLRRVRLDLAGLKRQLGDADRERDRR